MGIENLLGVANGAGEDLHLTVADNLLDLALLLKVGQALPCQRAVDLETIDQSGDGHQAVGLNILVQLLRGLLVQDDGVLGLVLDCWELVSVGRVPARRSGADDMA